MKATDIIQKKLRKESLTKTEIDFFISKFMINEIKDYQMTALNTAIFLNGLNEEEITYLTLAMLDSGEKLNLSSLKGPKADKHSTGGVGDKMTLIIGPMAAALGIKMAKMSGRGLGFTGGTLDKLESIPGFKIDISEKKFIEQVDRINFALVSQNKNLAPADKRIYDLRNDTGTVDSIALIAASIMSKKFASGAEIILLDVKCGTGAFIETLDKARELAKLMVKIGHLANKTVKAEITNMNEPLGKMIGNRNEVYEVKKFFENPNNYPDLKELAYTTVESLLLTSKIATTEKDANTLIENVMNSGNALQRFYNFIEAQGGDTKKLREDKLWNPKKSLEVKSYTNGFLEIINAKIFGIVANDLGAGRYLKEDKIDYEAGIELHKKTNDLVKKGDVLFTLYSSKKIEQKLVDDLLKAIKINESQIQKQNIIIERIE
ncbi:thymidine phosphorylase [[Mycoplasma] mobile]|uniref:Pyrimidine (Thymidine)-nucleoside phosphorylase n=1 Tax=Mycoplasma mobile (strain ATCC 43663 / 163K / NCTC 11711) TaxID=267748 RepID=Q6KHA8_MYCM1|nr:thymidine phosphorylase [[Mycoplasma] mobile]AAT28022.1 pyrimidine (thymidine)-nucleoside phosphorylase [Mycoplasma mobile 163K]